MKKKDHSKRLFKVILIASLLWGCGTKADELSPAAYSREDYERYEDNYFFRQLTDEEKDIYIAHDERLKNFERTVPIRHTTTKALTNAYNALMAYEPEYYWLDGIVSQYGAYGIEKKEYEGKPIDFSVITYFIDEKDIDQAKKDKKTIDRTAEELAAKLKGNDDFETLQNIHDYIVLNTVYVGDSEYNQDIRSVLFNHESVCAGYSRAFQLLAKKAGIECYYITGDAVEGSNTFSGFHAWNLIGLEGSYYWVDVTWDDPEDYGDLRYRYFLVPDDLFLLDHTIRKPKNVPECGSEERILFERKTAENVEEVLEAIEEMIRENKEECSLFFTNKEDYRNVLNELNLEETIRRINAVTGNRLIFRWVSDSYPEIDLINKNQKRRSYGKTDQ